MSIYTIFKKNQEKLLNDFNEKAVFYAFNEEQFNEGLKKLNVEKKDIKTIWGGGFLLKSKEVEYNELIKSMNSDFKQKIKEIDFLKSAIDYEYKNYEGCLESTLEALELLEEYKTNKKTRNIIDKTTNKIHFEW